MQRTGSWNIDRYEREREREKREREREREREGLLKSRELREVIELKRACSFSNGSNLSLSFLKKWEILSTKWKLWRYSIKKERKSLSI